MAAECKSCGDPVVWVKTINGKPMPLNAEPDPDGNVYPVLIDGERYARVATVKSPIPDHVPATSRFTAHFATCPHADEHRAPKGKT